MTRPDRVALESLLKPEGGDRLREIARAIDDGAIFIYPTETIYGLGGSCLIPGVREKILTAKKRPPGNPFIVLAAHRSSFAPLGISFPEEAERLAARFWPGLLTLVLPSTNDPDGVAVRVCAHPFITALSKFTATPLYSTSANMSGDPYQNDPDLIYRLFSGSVDFMIDAGPLPPSLPSTVVKAGMDGSITVLRNGAVPSHLV